MIVDWILRRYPTAWRERYEDELRDIVTSQGLTPGLVLDLLAGAVDARMHPRLVPSYADGVALPASERAVLSWESWRSICAAVLGVLSWLAWAVLGLYAIFGLFNLFWAFGLTPWLSLTGSVSTAKYLLGATYYVGGPVLGNTFLRHLVRAGWRWQPSRYAALALVPVVMVFWLAQGSSTNSNLRPIPDRPCHEVISSGEVICEYEPGE